MNTMSRCLITWGALVLCCLYGLGAQLNAPVSGADVPPVPRVLDTGYRLELFAEAPDIVTPIGMTFDKQGRLLVIESHTHFRPANYTGPPADRVRILRDTNNDGKADRIETYWEGTRASMSLATYAGDVYLATRNEILRLVHDEARGVATRAERLIFLDTSGDYPHNGLSGLCFDHLGRMVFGLGENLGVDYRVIGSDGQEMRGGGEGGNIYRCQRDGTSIERIATGLWNPFGICEDPVGRLFAVENDPDARPPCRLLHVAPGGDYGFQFRYGRSGKHPLQAWEGELPGTMPMVAGTGEAPSSVVAYQGHLWVTSWGDHQIERYRLVPQGATWRATSDVVIVGSENFRPAVFAVGPDKSLYFSDWVDRSYELHRKGRIWRLVPANASRVEPPFPAQRMLEHRAATAQQRVDWDAAGSHDPFLWQSGVWGLIQHGGSSLTPKQWVMLRTPQQRLGLLHAARWKEPNEKAWVQLAINDSDPAVRLAAVRWIADQRWTEYRPLVLKQLDRPDGTAALYRASIAAASWLEHGKPEWNAELLAQIATDSTRSEELRSWALRLLPPETRLEAGDWSALLQESSTMIREETAWAVVQQSDDDRTDLLLSIAKDLTQPAPVRAIALVGLVREFDGHRKLVEQLATNDQPLEVRTEAVRSLKYAAEALPSHDVDPQHDTDAWLNATAGAGDAASGRRLFFHPHGGRCYQCHRWNGQGSDIGPDLTDVGARMSRRRLIDSILVPSREVAPHYKAFELELHDGKLLTGMSLGQTGGGDRERFVDSQGDVFEVELKEVDERRMLPNTIMPEGLLDRLTPQDVRDLLQFLGAN